MDFRVPDGTFVTWMCQRYVLQSDGPLCPLLTLSIVLGRRIRLGELAGSPAPRLSKMSFPNREPIHATIAADLAGPSIISFSQIW